jgi:hypothetical protein
LASTGTSTFFVTEAELPLPSHWFSLQSPAVCVEVTVPSAVFEEPQTPALHVRTLQSVSTPGHVLATRHCTQAPAPVHTVPPLSAQAEPAAVGVCEGTPPVQISLVQFVASTGISLLSFPETMAPLPLHVFFLQSPALCIATAVPAAVNEKPHTVAVQVRV